MVQAYTIIYRLVSRDVFDNGFLRVLFWHYERVLKRNSFLYNQRGNRRVLAGGLLRLSGRTTEDPVA